MAADQCNNFVGNAWKKDLCLNCFKSKEEHVFRNGCLDVIVSGRLPDPPKEGILKGKKTKNSTSKANKVIFPNTEYEVIGFGGDDSYSDDDYPDFCNTKIEDEDFEDSEEDKAFQKLTKTNTDYNSVPENLQEPKNGEVKKIIEPLKLGKQVFDDKGNKKTLLVSVTPFSDQTAVKTQMGGVKINMSAVKEMMKQNGFTVNSNGYDKPDFIARKKAFLTENGRNVFEETDVIPNDKLIQKSVTNDAYDEKNNEKSEKSEESENASDIAQLISDDSFNKVANDKSLKRSQPLDKNFKFRIIKDLQKENDKNSELNNSYEVISKNEKFKPPERVSNLIEKAKKKVNQFSVVTDSPSFKYKTKDFTNSSAKKMIEAKAIVFDICNIQEKKDVSTGKVINDNQNKSETLVKEMPIKTSSAEVKISVSPPDICKEKVVNGYSINFENEVAIERYKPDENNKKYESTIDRSKLIPNMSSLYRHQFKNRLAAKEEDNKQGVVKELVNAIASTEPVKEGELDEVNDELNEVQEKTLNANEINGNKLEDTNQNNKNNNYNYYELASKHVKFKKLSLENFENINKDEEIILFTTKNRIDLQTNNDVIDRHNSEEPSLDWNASDETSVPSALPTKPPPPLSESKVSFLHDMSSNTEEGKSSLEKPKIPVKPLIIQSKRANFQSAIHKGCQESPSELLLNASSPTVKAHLPLQETLSSDSNKNQKRPAPKPPSPKEDPRYVVVMSDMYESVEPQEHETEDSTVGRLSRSTENILELLTDKENNQMNAEESEENVVPEPVPRSLSLSQDSLLTCETGDIQGKKRLSRGRFFLQKLLHLGKAKDGKETSTRQRCFLPQTSKPKLEIIHPNDLNGSRVEVVPPSRTFKSRRTSSSASSSSGEHRESDVVSDSSASHSASSSGNDCLSTMDRTKKPPPPPRSHLLDPWNSKPARPPPPRSIKILRQNNSSWNNSIELKPDGLYVNLGEVRSSLAPNKPIRTASLREVNMDNAKRLVTVTTQPDDSDYESFVVPSAQYSSSSPQPDDNLYECVQTTNHRSSLPECDSAAECLSSTYEKGKKFSTTRDAHRRSEGNVDLNSDFKLKFFRSVSMPYCASETESEIYAPYSFYSNELGEDDYGVSPTNQILRMSRLKLKKGRSIVHKNLEDNYGAVVIANHEALAQVVENMRQGPTAPPALRAMSSVVNLRWTDFSVTKDAIGVVVERRVFYPAAWGLHNVTLSLMAERGLNSSLHAKGPFSLNPITELNDLVPALYLPMLKKDDSELIQASISVLARLQIETIENYGRNLMNEISGDEVKKEVNFVLLQIINGLKSLQAQGIEEASKNLTNFVVCREEKDPHPRICIIDSYERTEHATSLCQCLIHIMKEILPPTDLTLLISNILLKEKAVSLSQAKGILEFVLWGPADISFGNSLRVREAALQRWLDLERATVLHGLVRTRADLTVFEEWQLLFLVRTSAKIMAEASVLLENGMDEEASTA